MKRDPDQAHELTAPEPLPEKKSDAPPARLTAPAWWFDAWWSGLRSMERPRAFILTLVVLLLAAILWSIFARIDRVIRGEGIVVPSGHSQTVQHLEGGMVAQIDVHEGQVVKKGDVLYRINDTQASSVLDQGEVRLYGLRARVARLTAEANGDAEMIIPADTKPDDPAMQAELATFRARHESFSEQQATARTQLEQRNAELNEAESKLASARSEHETAMNQWQVVNALQAQKAASQMEVLDAKAREQRLASVITETSALLPRIRASIAEAQSHMRETSAKIRSDASVELSAAQVDLAREAEEIRNQSDRVNRTDVRAPIGGVVNHVFFNTLGGVVKPGDALVELTPVDGDLVIEARIRPSDRGELRPGLPARIKISAYDYAVYGSLPGEVTEISADTLSNEHGDRFYRLKVSVAKTLKQRSDKPIYPGMTVNVDVVVGNRTPAEYLISPIRRFYQSAFREAR
jgi:adhesin transport system membrane fusion protein